MVGVWGIGVWFVSFRVLFCEVYADGIDLEGLVTSELVIDVRF